MTRVVTHDDKPSGRGFCEKDLGGELLSPGLSDNANRKNKGGNALDAMIREVEVAPKEVPKQLIWTVLSKVYQLLPDDDGTTRRNSVSSSESNVSVSFEDLQDSFAKLKEDLLTSLPTLVAPKVSELLSPRNDAIGDDSDAKRNQAPDTPVKRFVSIKADKSDEGATPICQKRWADIV